VVAKEDLLITNLRQTVEVNQEQLTPVVVVAVVGIQVLERLMVETAALE
jgi:hypothetical protein